MTWEDIGYWRAWLEAASWLELLICVSPVLVALAIGLGIGGPDIVFDGRRKTHIVGKEQPLWVQARFGSDDPWVEQAEFAIYDRLNERTQRGYAPRAGLGALYASSDADEDG